MTRQSILLLSLLTMLTRLQQQRHSWRQEGDWLGCRDGQRPRDHDRRSRRGGTRAGVTFGTRDGDKARAAVRQRSQAARRRMDASLVSQGEVALLMKQVAKFTDQQIAAYQAANPYVFAKRQILTVDQTQVMPRAPLPKGGRDTSYALMEQLAQLQLQTKEARVQLDSANLPAAATKALIEQPTVPVQVDNGTVVTF
ncbi:MAG: hypothetical protein EOP58_16785, partial [Sphingomonadales bacterium]